MNYLSLSFYLFVGVCLAVYYLLPLRFRWYALLLGSLWFYYQISTPPRTFWAFLGTIVISYALGLALDAALRLARQRAGKFYALLPRLVLAAGILSVALPLLVVKNSNFILSSWLHRPTVRWLVPLGISFYSLQIIGYLADVYRGKAAPQRDLLKYALFVSFFPQIVQGPIPRYGQLQGQLVEGHRFDERTFVLGLQQILWGFFLKYMIADKAGVIVNTVFGNYRMYRGSYVLIAGFLYSIQLYADFLSCVKLSQGVAGLFGIRLADNFMRPYQAQSIQEFWRRWHISLTNWLRDYVYIPLGGNRRGTLRKYINLTIVFAVSGIWHGAGYKFLFWGLLHAGYQIVGSLTAPAKDKLYNALQMPKGCLPRRVIQTAGTFFWAMLGWIIFRADSLRQGLSMILSLFTVYNPWVFWNDNLLMLGLGWRECVLLTACILLLFCIEHVQSTRSVREWVLRQHLLVRWVLYIGAICMIWVMGTYGYGFNAQDFIYGGF